MGRGSAPGEHRGGRKKGTRNRKTRDRLEVIARKGITPLEYMLRVMRSTSAEVERRDDMSKAAAPYVHPRLTAVEATGKDGSPLIPPPPDPMEVARRVAFLLNSANQKPTTEG